MRGTCAATSVEKEAPRSSAQCATCGQWSSSNPRRRQITRAAYGSASSLTSSTRPRPAKPSTSSSASAVNEGRIASIERLRKAGSSSRRTRWWSSPSRLSSVSAHQSWKRPEWMPFCSGHRALPCTKRRSRSSAAPCWWRSTAAPYGVRAHHERSRAACTCSPLVSKPGSARSSQGTSGAIAVPGSVLIAAS